MKCPLCNKTLVKSKWCDCPEAKDLHKEVERIIAEDKRIGKS